MGTLLRPQRVVAERRKGRTPGCTSDMSCYPFLDVGFLPQYEQHSSHSCLALALPTHKPVQWQHVSKWCALSQGMKPLSEGTAFGVLC